MVNKIVDKAAFKESSQRKKPNKKGVNNLKKC